MNFASIFNMNFKFSTLLKWSNLGMVSEKGVSLKVDSQKRIGVSDVINMLKGLRNEAVIKIVKTSENEHYKIDKEQTKSKISPVEKFNKTYSVKGNTKLPQIRELNEIAALLRSMDVHQNQI